MPLHKGTVFALIFLEKSCAKPRPKLHVMDHSNSISDTPWAREGLHGWLTAGHSTARKGLMIKGEKKKKKGRGCK